MLRNHAYGNRAALVNNLLLLIDVLREEVLNEELKNALISLGAFCWFVNRVLEVCFEALGHVSEERSVERHRICRLRASLQKRFVKKRSHEDAE